jgi:hypothetical protein
MYDVKDSGWQSRTNKLEKEKKKGSSGNLLFRGACNRLHFIFSSSSLSFSLMSLSVLS